MKDLRVLNWVLFILPSFDRQLHKKKIAVADRLLHPESFAKERIPSFMSIPVFVADMQIKNGGDTANAVLLQFHLPRLLAGAQIQRALLFAY